jgi:hypothetical protein
MRENTCLFLVPNFVPHYISVTKWPTNMVSLSWHPNLDKQPLKNQHVQYGKKKKLKENCSWSSPFPRWRHGFLSKYTHSRNFVKVTISKRSYKYKVAAKSWLEFATLTSEISVDSPGGTMRNTVTNRQATPPPLHKKHLLMTWNPSIVAPLKGIVCNESWGVGKIAIDR